MPITLHELVANLAKRPLPAMSVTAQRVRQLLDNPNTSNNDLQQTIGLDPGLTMDIYRRFGIASGNRRGPVSNIAHAISMLGPAPVKVAVNSLPVLDKNLPEAAKSGIYHCYSRAIHASFYAQDIGRQRGDKNPEEMGHAALLYNCAEMALWTYANKTMQKIQRTVRHGADYGSASHSVLGFTLEQLSAELARVWHLSPLITQTIDHAWHSQPRPMAVVLASSLARASALGWYSVETSGLIEFLADFRRQSREKTIAHIHTQTASIARQLRGVPLPVPAYNILQQTPEPISTTPEPRLESTKKAASKRVTASIAEKPPTRPKKKPETPLTTTPAKRPQTKPDPKQDPKPTRAAATISQTAQPIKVPVKAMAAKPQKQALVQKQTQSSSEKEPVAKPIQPTGKSVDSSAATGSTNKTRQVTVEQIRLSVPAEWKDPLSRFMRNLRSDLGLKRIMFAMLSQDNKQAGMARLIGADTYSKLHKFSLGVEEKNLFSILLSKQQGLWLKPDNSAKFLPLIPEHVIESIDKYGFFCMSVFVHNQPVGFVYADGIKAMNEGCYTQFKQLCASLSSDLENTRQ